MQAFNCLGINANVAKRANATNFFVFFSRFSSYSRNSRLRQFAGIESRQDFTKALAMRFKEVTKRFLSGFVPSRLCG